MPNAFIPRAQVHEWSDAIGANHSSALDTRFHPSRVTYPAPFGSTIPWPTMCTVGSLMNAIRFQYSFGNARAV